MSDDMLAIVAGAVSFWEESTGATLIQTYPTDWRPEILYAEWLWAPYQGPGSSHYYPGRKAKKPKLYNGNSTSRDFVGPLQDLLRTIEEKHGVVIDHILMKRNEGRVSVLWHLPGQRVRKHGTAPIADATVPAPTKNFEKLHEGVEA